MRLPLPTDDDAKPVLRCARCAREFPFGPPFVRYPTCDASKVAGDKCLLETRYQSLKLRPAEDDALPATPLLGPERLRRRVGLPAMWLKNEAALPTLSWKDRVNRVHARLANKWGFETVIAISTGNHGISLAAQARAGGLSCRVLIHQDCPAFTRGLIEHFGARVETYREEPEAQLRDWVESRGAYPAVSLPPAGGIGNPFGAEGYKSIASEIAASMPVSERTWIVIPAGIGDGVFGIWKGFSELRSIGTIDSLPRLVAVQGSQCAPLAHAIERGLETSERIASPRGIALSIREPWSGAHALGAIRASGGTAIGVTDDEIRDAMSSLMDEGLLFEPASAATVAAAQRLVARGTIDRAETVVCILSGSGFKWAGADWLQRGQ